MGFMVEDLLRTEECREMKLICGEQGLKNEIKGVTIIEAPDIVKFINGGELLLTGLYAFKSCSIEEFHNQNLSKTAQELYVHYKTAAYRIEKIAKITGMDFDNANEMLAVRIGLVVCKMIENYNKK